MHFSGSDLLIFDIFYNHSFRKNMYFKIIGIYIRFSFRFYINI